jgi:phosphoadenosine phosphosulfate reductase
MSANSNAETQLPAILEELSQLAIQYSGRTLFSTRFCFEDQVLAHLIITQKLPIRIFSYSAADQYDILVRSVDYFNHSIEVSFRQARDFSSEHLSAHPELRVTYNKYPEIAPIQYILQEHHLLISSRRRSQLILSQDNPVPLEWDESRKRSVFYPLFDWTDADIYRYLKTHQIPTQTAVPDIEEESVAAFNLGSFLDRIGVGRFRNKKTTEGKLFEGFQFRAPERAQFGLLD